MIDYLISLAINYIIYIYNDSINNVLLLSNNKK